MPIKGRWAAVAVQAIYAAENGSSPLARLYCHGKGYLDGIKPEMPTRDEVLQKYNTLGGLTF